MAEYTLSADSSRWTIPIDKDLKRQNMVIEVLSLEDNGIKRLISYFGCEAKVRVYQSLGQIKVYHTSEHNGSEIPLPGSYVKVYQRKEGVTSFFKDGYTDLNGKFLYGHLSGVSIAGIERFSILISHDKHGSLVKEAAPPSLSI